MTALRHTQHFVKDCFAPCKVECALPTSPDDCWDRRDYHVGLRHMCMLQPMLHRYLESSHPAAEAEGRLLPMTSATASIASMRFIIAN